MRSEGNGRTVLVLEDQEWIRSGMKRSLEQRGYRVLEASGCEDALGITETSRPALILTEEQVPCFEDFMAGLRQRALPQAIPVVIINPDAEDQTLYGDALILTDYSHIERLMDASPDRARPE